MDELEAGLSLDAVGPGHTHPARPQGRTLGRDEVRRGAGEILLGRVNVNIVLLLLAVVVGSTYSGLKQGDSRTFRSYPFSAFPFIQLLGELLINSLKPLNRLVKKWLSDFIYLLEFFSRPCLDCDLLPVLLSVTQSLPHGQEPGLPLHGLDALPLQPLLLPVHLVELLVKPGE